MLTPHIQPRRKNAGIDGHYDLPSQEDNSVNALGHEQVTLLLMSRDDIAWI